MKSFALDHLTVVDTTPSQLITVAAKAGYSGVCVFLQPMEVLPSMPAFAMIGDTAERRETKARAEGYGVAIDLAYPFTLSARTEVMSLRPALETAAWIGARAVNALVYDRDASRRVDVVSRFCSLAHEYGLHVAVEFYPSSQIRTLGAALELIGSIDSAARVGVNVDLLHLMRSGGNFGELASVPPPRIAYAQFCDGPAQIDPQRAEWEASSQRLLPGEGVFDLRGFAEALPAGTPASIELPRRDALERGLSQASRAKCALDATLKSLGTLNESVA